MLNAIHMTLMVGPAVPIPVSRDVLDALTGVQVTTTTEGPSAFQLQFALNNRSPLHSIFLLSAGLPIPLVRVVIVVTVQGTSQVLIDGVMTNHQVSPSSAGHSTLTVTGEDLSRVMDYIDFSGIPYPAMPREARVALIVAKYAMFGIIPVVIPSVVVDVPLPISKIPGQRGKDLAYVKILAEEVGYDFYFEPGPTPGTSFAYWGPQIRVGVAQKALNFDMDAHTNVESLSFSYNAERKTLPILVIFNEQTHVPIPIPLPSFNPLSPPLGLVEPFPKNVQLMIGTAKASVPQAIAIGLAKAAKTADVVEGTGTLDVLRYGRILQARRLVGVRGVGPAFDGLYYVKSVTHDLKRGEYKQSFKLARNGLLSTLPSVNA